MFSASSRGMLVGPSGLMVGLDTFQTLAAEVAAALGVTLDDPDTQLVATNIWAFVHGVVALRTARPHFPWPDVRLMIDDMVDRVLRLDPGSNISAQRRSSGSTSRPSISTPPTSVSPWGVPNSTRLTPASISDCAWAAT